jgi:benzoylformate decarboxylase
VWGANSSEVNIGANHPLFKGLLGHMFGEHSKAIVAKADAILVCGTYVFPEVFPALDDVFSSGAKVIHIDLDGYEIAKNFPVDLGLLGDPKTSLAALGDALDSSMTESRRKSAASRSADIGAANDKALTAQLAADRAVRDEVPMHASRFMEELSELVPKDAIIFDEALTTSPELVRYLPPVLPGHYFQTRGGSLGVGIPGALGLKVAHPDKTVIGFTGDGGSMYTIQALWTAAHYNIGAKFVICNNQSYLLLKLNILEYWRERGLPEHDFPASFDLGEPVIRFDDLARSMGVPAARVETPDQIGPAIRKALEHDGPFLIDLVITNHVPGSKINCKCGQ